MVAGIGGIGVVGCWSVGVVGFCVVVVGRRVSIVGRVVVVVGRLEEHGV